MTQPLELRNEMLLDGTPGSPTRARRFMADTLRDWGCEALIEDAVICVSELVANAVVHAGTETQLVVTWTGSRLRVEVRDRSRRSAIGPTTMSVISETAEADAPLDRMSGRGLYIVASLAAALGEGLDETGKAVWFELDEDRSDGSGRSSVAAVVQPSARGADSLSASGDAGTAHARLLAVPVRLAIESENHIGDLRREAKLISDMPITSELGPALDAFGGVFPYCDAGSEQVRVAAALHRATVDVQIGLEEALPAQLQRAHYVLLEVEELARTDRLLVSPASDDVRAFWSWAVGELEAQSTGAKPTSFPARDS